MQEKTNYLRGDRGHVKMGSSNHAAINPSQTAGALVEAPRKYLGWEVYYHEKVKQ